jgi:hypothetical protein
MNFAEAHSRRVTSVSIDREGYVSWLWNDDGDWSPQSTIEAMIDIELGSASYFVQWPEENTDVIDATDAGGRYLRTTRDVESHNSLLDLPRRRSPDQRDFGGTML